MGRRRFVVESLGIGPLSHWSLKEYAASVMTNDLMTNDVLLLTCFTK